jgi:hypothetical protein
MNTSTCALPFTLNQLSRKGGPVFISRRPIKYPPLCPVVIYEDQPALMRVKELLQRLARCMGSNVRFAPQFWRFDQLNDPDTWIDAMVDSGAASMLILTASSKSDLPTAVIQWLESHIEKMSGSGNAVVALIGRAGQLDGPDSPRLWFLKAAANKASLDFFAPQPSFHLPCPPSKANMREREIVVTSTLDGILHHSPGG